jgi:putative SOS response-associated peptidase YedK
MCNLYSLNKKRDAVARFFRVSHNRSAVFRPASAIFPRHVAPVVLPAADGEREIVTMSRIAECPPPYRLRTESRRGARHVWPTRRSVVRVRRITKHTWGSRRSASGRVAIAMEGGERRTCERRRLRKPPSLGMALACPGLERPPFPAAIVATPANIL